MTHTIHDSHSLPMHQDGLLSRTLKAQSISNRTLQNCYIGTEHPFDRLPFPSSPGGSSEYSLLNQSQCNLGADKLRWIAATGA